MANTEENLTQNWKRPDELLKLHRLKQKKKQLAARIKNNNSNRPDINETDRATLLEAVVAQKRKNPFAKFNDNDKKARTEAEGLDLQEDSLLNLINTPLAGSALVHEAPTRSTVAKLDLQPFNQESFSKLLQQNIPAEDDDIALDEQKFSKHLPMDWSLKTRARFFCHSELPATTLKTSQMASGLTSCVRCIDMNNTGSGLDISPAARFNQATYYWQHPHLPWLTMFPRNAKENIGIQLGERERKALLDDWDHSFRGLFQLLRARQCPYFYLCANTFTILFRAAGTGGRVETHALMSPTTRGMRSALRQEGIEYTLPLKKIHTGLNKSADGSLSIDEVKRTESVDTTMPASCQPSDGDGSANGKCAIEEDDEDDDWLESLGVDEKEILRIQNAHSRQKKAREMADDFSDISLVLIEGVECQGFFSFLLNAKSTIPTVGRLAGVPPTLLAPVAFPKATLQHLKTRSNKVRMDGVDYCSIEVKGIVLPTFLPSICELLSESKDTFSATLATATNTIAFSKATQKLLEDPNQNYEGNVENTGQVFGQENLSDCGLSTSVIETICRTGPNVVGLLERVCFDKEYRYAWNSQS